MHCTRGDLFGAMPDPKEDLEYWLSHVRILRLAWPKALAKVVRSSYSNHVDVDGLLNHSKRRQHHGNVSDAAVAPSEFVCLSCARAFPSKRAYLGHQARYHDYIPRARYYVLPDQVCHACMKHQVAWWCRGNNSGKSLNRAAHLRNRFLFAAV